MIGSSFATQWWEIVVTGDPLLEELIFWQLQVFGCQGTASQVEAQILTVKAYRPQNQVDLEALTQLADWLRQEAVGMGCEPPHIQWHRIAESDWANTWKEYWHPREIGDRILIYPEWLVVPKTERLLVRLNPGAAFGTGEHATTQLCLRTLESLLRPSSNNHGQELAGSNGCASNPVTLADVGCGSGILSIAALLLGVERTYGVDTDPLAVDTARQNRELNGIARDRFPIECGSIDRLVEMLEQPVNGLVCNILAEVILQLLPQFGQVAKPGGWGILSGILTRQVPSLTAALEQQGWRAIASHQQEDWCCFHIART